MPVHHGKKFIEARGKVDRESEYSPAEAMRLVPPGIPIVTVDGLNVSPAEMAKAAGVNLALWTGLIMLAIGVLFVLWTLLSPPEITHGHEMSEDDLPEQLRHHGLEAIPEHSSDDPERRRRPPAH